MKYIYILGGFILLLGCNFKRQQNAISVFSTIPSFNLLLLDSSTIFNTKQITIGKPILLMYFSPDCEHCQNQTANLLKNISSLKNVQIYLFSPSPFNELKEFYNYFHLDNYKNITVGKDYEYAFYKFYKADSFPWTVIYDTKKQLVRLYKKEIRIEQIVDAVHPI